MSSLSRTARRAAERKAAKLARKQNAAHPAGTTQAATVPTPLYKAPPPPPNIDEMDPESPEFETYALQLIREVEERHGIFATEPPRLTAALRAPAAPTPPQPPTPSATPTRRTESNRQNAQLSSGPRTPEGKLASSRNSLKHGLASSKLIIPGEDPAQYEALLADLTNQHQPANPTEVLLIAEMAQSYWLTQRAIRLQNQCFETAEVNEKQLALYLRYQTTHQRAFHKALATLVRMKKDHSRELTSRLALQEQVEAALAKPIPDISHILQEFSNPPGGFVSQNAVSPTDSDQAQIIPTLPTGFEFRNPASPNRQKTAA